MSVQSMHESTRMQSPSRATAASFRIPVLRRWKFVVLPEVLCGFQRCARAGNNADLCMKNKDVFKQCRAAAIAMNAVFPRGIQVFRLGCTTASWYFSVFGNVKSESFEDGVDFSSMQCGMASLLYEGCTFVPVLYPSFQCRLGRLLECCYHCMWQGVCEHTGAVSMMLATPLPKPHPYFHKCCAKVLFYLEYPSEAPADVSYTVMRHMLVLHMISEDPDPGL